MELRSSAFSDNGDLPRKYSCDGANVSPPLEWSGPPQDTKSFALVVDDPDAPGGTFVHWIAYDIPPAITRLEEGVPARQGNGGFRQARNDFGKPGYGGACPPKGHGAHRYNFRVCALDAMLGKDADAAPEDILTAIEAHKLDEAVISARYGR